MKNLGTVSINDGEGITRIYFTLVSNMLYPNLKHPYDEDVCVDVKGNIVYAGTVEEMNRYLIRIATDYLLENKFLIALDGYDYPAYKWNF
jgi:hypothetical protein